jgi:hypothetical protein
MANYGERNWECSSEVECMLRVLGSIPKTSKQAHIELDLLEWVLPKTKKSTN